MTTLKFAFDGLIAKLWVTYEEGARAANMELDGRLCEASRDFHTVVQNARTLGPSDACNKLIMAIFRLRHYPYPHQARSALFKLHAIARATRDYLDGNLKPRRIGTLREVNLVSICNARCIYCIGLYTREIVEGQTFDNQRCKRMAPEHVTRAFFRKRDISSFFMNGSEFLLYPNWRELVDEFSQEAIRLRLATNGMLMTPDASEFLIKKRVLENMTFSLDGARRETTERVRPLVQYDVVLGNIEFFIYEMHRQGCKMPVSLSMILLRSTLSEASELVVLAARLRKGRRTTVLHVNYYGLNPSLNEGYRAFYERERVDLRDVKAQHELRRAVELGESFGIPTFYGYNGTLASALENATILTQSIDDHEANNPRIAPGRPPSTARRDCLPPPRLRIS